MASHESIIRMNENAVRGPEKMQQKARRKPLGDVTNSSKPQYKDKPSSKNVSSFRAVEKLRPQTGRKPLGDLTNSSKPHVKEKPSKNFCSQVQPLGGGAAGEKFCHDHQQCIKAHRQSMSMDSFLETVALQKCDKKEVCASMFTPRFPVMSTASKLKLETPMKYASDEFELDMSDICGGTPAPKSPVWKDVDFSGFKLKEEFSGFKLKGTP